MMFKTSNYWWKCEKGKSQNNKESGVAFKKIRKNNESDYICLEENLKECMSNINGSYTWKIGPVGKESFIFVFICFSVVWISYNKPVLLCNLSTYIIKNEK